MATPPGRQDQRPRRGDARRRILEAASHLLEERRWADLRLEDVMTAAGLSRTAFYRHFVDRRALLLAMVDAVRGPVAGSGLAWKNGEGDPVVALRTGLGELAAAMRDHGRLMQAVADSAATDAEMRAAHDDMVRRFVAVTAERIGADVAAGRSRVRAPERVADALVRMNESLLLDAFGAPPYPDTETVVATMLEVWAATIYGRERLDAHDPPAEG
jgi:TetR/AcrR family transcriptional regulator, ethionamide resistance regulator